MCWLYEYVLRVQTTLGWSVIKVHVWDVDYLGNSELL